MEKKAAESDEEQRHGIGRRITFDKRILLSKASLVKEARLLFQQTFPLTISLHGLLFLRTTDTIIIISVVRITEFDGEGRLLFVRSLQEKSIAVKNVREGEFGISFS